MREAIKAHSTNSIVNDAYSLPDQLRSPLEQLVPLVLSRAWTVSPQAPQERAQSEDVTFLRTGPGAGSAGTRFVVTPEELVDKHPHLYHVTAPRNWEGIQKPVLLSTSRLLSLSECSDAARAGSESDND
jgi:hypothetical protein